MQGRDGGFELLYYVFPSPRGIDWASPTRLLWSALASLLRFKFEREHQIGHVNIELRRALPGSGVLEPRGSEVLEPHGSEVLEPHGSEVLEPHGSEVLEPHGVEREFLTGMTSSTRGDTTRAVLAEQMGLGVLFHHFGGRLETAEEVERQWPERRTWGELAVLRILLSDEAANRARRFEQEFRERGHSAHYALPLRPRYGEGGGCSAYGVSFLEITGLLTEEMRTRWSRNIRVPEALIGSRSPKRRIHFIWLLIAFWKGWAKPEEPHREILFWDPDAMYRWMIEVHASSRPEFAKSEVGAVKVLTWDARGVPAPQGPIWLEAEGK